MKLDLGGIGKRNGKDGWFTVNCGAAEEWCDYRADITELDGLFKDKSIEYILCSHTLEHLRCDQHKSALALWHRKLVRNGLLEIILPDGENIVQRYAAGEVAWLTVMNVLYGVPAWLMENPYNQHLYAFSCESLKALVEQCGYSVIEQKQRSWKHNYANESSEPYFGTFMVHDIHIICRAMG